MSYDIGTNKLACIVVRYFDKNLGTIESALWELVTVLDETETQGTAQHIFNKIINSFKEFQIPVNRNIIGFASDGCNVMMAHNSVATRFMELCPGIFILKCICHSLHICSSEACKSLPRSIKDLARNVYNFFKVYH